MIDDKDKSAVMLWKIKIFRILFSVICLLALLPYLTSISYVVKYGMHFNFISYTINYILCFLILFYKPWELKIRARLGILCFYLLAVTAIYTVGPMGSGRMWLFALSILASLFLGVRASVITVLVNAPVLLAVGILIEHAFFPWLSDEAVGVAHDYNNISSIIIGYAELTIADMEEGSPEKSATGYFLMRHSSTRFSPISS